MRNLITTKKWSVCLIAAEGADYSEGGGGDTAVDGDAATEAYRASGTDPFWTLTMGNGQMVFGLADRPDVTVATPKPQSTRTGPRYETPEMTVHINNFRRCQDADGQEYHDTVRVTIGTQTFEGCGGARVESD